MSIFRWLVYGLKKKPGKIVFNNFNGRGFGCNPKYIALSLLEDNQNEQYDLVWLLENHQDVALLPEGIRTVEFTSRNVQYEIATADVIVSNVRIGNFFTRGGRKKADQLYIQTWHGGLGVKKIEADVATLSEKYIKEAQIDSDAIDILLSNNAFITDYFRKSFFYSGEILEIGNPRNDIFFRNNEDSIQQVRKRLGIPKENRVVLYLPTFRDSSDGLGNGERINLRSVVSALEKRFGNNWIALSRLHPNMKKNNYWEEAIDVTDYPDIQELLCVADVVITDYSSAVFDFMLSKKPAFIYAADYGFFKKQRGFILDPKLLPFSYSSNNKELLKNIYLFDEKSYCKLIVDFEKKYHCVDNGQASIICRDIIKHHVFG